MFETWNEAPLDTALSICIHVMFSSEKQNSPSGGVAAQARGAMTIVLGVVRGGLGLFGIWGKSLLTLLLAESMHDVLSAASSRRGVCMS
jgi:hypothetical protein